MRGSIVVALVLSAVLAERGARSLRRDRSLKPFVARTRQPRRVQPSAGHRAMAASALACVMVSVLWGLVAGVLAGVTAWAAWTLRQRRRHAKNLAERDEQLADAVRSMASAMRAGMSVSQAIGFAAREAVPPLEATLASMDAALGVGVPFDEALDAWTRAVGSDDARLVAGVLRLNRRSGGDLPAVLDQVAATLRDRRAAAREVRALTAQARLSGTILGVLPVGFFAFLWLTSRREIEGAFRSPAGVGAIALGLCLEGLAFLWIRRLLEVR